MHQQNMYNKRLLVTQQYIISQNANSSKQWFFLPISPLLLHMSIKLHIAKHRHIKLF